MALAAIGGGPPNTCTECGRRGLKLNRCDDCCRFYCDGHMAQVGMTSRCDSCEAIKREEERGPVFPR